jgi:hypothetical protein
MKGDFSRQTFDPQKHYSAVLMQQGRVQLDADWNEQQAIGLYRDETTALDVIGACGAPMDNAGFAIATDGKALTIGKGRMYVDGILCENGQADLDYLQQPDLPYKAVDQTQAPTMLELLVAAKAQAAIVYLDVWQRHLTALEDGLIREKALNGPDTASRVKTVWQVRVLPIPSATKSSLALEQLVKEKKKLEFELVRLKRSKKPNLELIKKLEMELALVEKKIAELEQATLSLSCDGQYPEWDNQVAPNQGKLNAQTQQKKDDQPCILPPSAGYQRLENQLYRVEIHNGGALKKGATSTVTFKWSRDNGSVVAAIEKISGQTITVHDVGPDDVLGFAANQWVELSDDWLELNGEPGALAQIADVNAATRVITLQSAPAISIDLSRHPKLRRWDQTGDAGIASGVQAKTDWTDLEGGIQVQFSADTYKPGDYWLIPARTATGEIEWPPFEIPNTNPEAQPALGIRHHYCRLAIVQIEQGKLKFNADCRNLFPPLTKVCAKQSALHVTGTNWKNDAVFLTGQIQKEGLRIFFDQLPDPLSLNGAAVKDSSPTVIVSVELPSGSDSASPDFSIILDGTITLGSNYLQWTPSQLASDTFDKLMSQQPLMRANVTLKGHCIWSKQGNTLIYLDGQAFGQPALLTEAKTQRIDLVFPTGDCARASDFESWFYVQTGQPPPAKTLQVESVTFMSQAGKSSSAGKISGAPNASVKLNVEDQASIAGITFNRAVDPKSISEQSVGVLLKYQNVYERLPGKLAVTGNLVEVTLSEPLVNPYSYFSYALLVAGTVTDSYKLFTTAPVKAADDGTALDGGYNNQPGSDFVLPITIIEAGKP